MKASSMLAAGILCLTTAAQSFASVLIFHDNFESYTTGSSPTNPGDGNGNNWFFTGLTTHNVISGGAPNGESPNEQLLHVNGTTISSFGRNFARQDGSPGPGYELTLSFKLQINSFAGNDYSIRLIDSTLSSANNPVNIRIASNGSVLVLTRPNGPGSGTPTNSVNPLGAALVANVWYEFSINVNLSEQTYELVINDLDSGHTGSTGPLYFAQNIQALDQLLFLSTSGTNPGVNWHIDDVRLTAIPEPSTTAALLIGIGLLGGSLPFRRRWSGVTLNR